MQVTSGKRRIAAAAISLLCASLAGCTHGETSHPRSLAQPPGATASDSGADDPQGNDLPGFGPGLEASSGDNALAVALLTVPAYADYVSFTDLAHAKKRLGYPDLTSDSPTHERFDFWEAARADGSLLTGTRLYDDSSLMSLDYGWTGEDVDWEVDFSATETGCTRAMLCGRATGYVLALRRDLDWRTVLTSLVDNGFEPDSSQFGLWISDEPGTGSQPFDELLLIPQLHAVASGDPIGVKRIVDVVGGAPSLGANVSGLVDALGPVESAYVQQHGCIDLDEALGPNNTQDDIDAYFRKFDLSPLATADGYAVGIDSAHQATSVLRLAADAPPDEAATRIGIINDWPGAPDSVPFSDVATANVQVSGQYELAEYAVRAMPAFASAVLTHEAPWALCPAEPPT